MAVNTNSLLQKLSTINDFGVTLDTTRQIIEQLNICPTYPIILVGGTNGKGSVCAYLTSILKNGGYKIGTYTSPHVFSYTERICINNQQIASDDLIQELTQVYSASNDKLGLFKIFTLAAHLYFINQRIDIAIVEVGIGGMHDVTNLFEPEISVITSIDYDHCHILGNSLDEIALQKAGIFRTNKFGFVGTANPPQSLLDYARAIDTKLQLAKINFGYIGHDNCFDVWCDQKKYWSLPLPALRGMEQLNNATLAIAILNKLHNLFPIGIAAIKTGLIQTKLIGRFQLMPGLPQIILDVAHNSQAVSHMLKNMLKLPFAKNDYAVFGCKDDKDIAGIIKQCAQRFSKWFIAPLNCKHSITNEQLIKIMLDNQVKSEQIVVCDSIESACEQTLTIMVDHDRLTCFGSFLVVEEAYAAINKIRYPKNK
jgi:dihydrofolate synthase / folylpolyglutamate synthase